MFLRHLKSSYIQFLCLQGRQSSSFSTTKALACQGAKFAGRVGPKRATMGVEVEAAMCIGPLSGPTKREEWEISSLTSLRFSLPTKERGEAVLFFRISSSAFWSSLVPTRTILTPGRLARRFVSCTKLFTPQSRNAFPALMWMVIILFPSSEFSSMNFFTFTTSVFCAWGRYREGRDLTSTPRAFTRLMWFSTLWKCPSLGLRGSLMLYIKFLYFIL